MGRRAQKPRAVALTEVAFAFLGFLLVVSALLAGFAGLPAIMALFRAIIVSLLCLAGLAFLVWCLWRYSSREQLGPAAPVIRYSDRTGRGWVKV
jgi:hypothetical protein